MSAEPVTLVAGLAPAAPVMRILSRFDRAKIEAFAEISIALLDLIDGDADNETCRAEDDFTPMPADIDFGPGCSIADPGGGSPTEDCLGGTPFIGDPGEHEVAI